MDKRKKLLIYMAAAHMLLSMMVVVIHHHSRKRKRGTPRERISYGPVDERDRMRLEYLENKIGKNVVTCVNMLRLSKASFSIFVSYLGTVDCCKTLYICVLSNRLPCF